MTGVFLGDEGKASKNGSIGMGANTYSPPDGSVKVYNDYFGKRRPGHSIDAYMEVWDYAGGCSFRGFVGGNGDKKSLFAFYDSSIVGRDMKQGYV